MTYLHNWSITSVFGHPLNNDCIYKVVGKLISTSADNSVESQHDFYLAPNVIPDSDLEIASNGSPEITWVDSLPGYTPIAELTEDMIWQWIDANESRQSFELINESKMPKLVAAKINLPFIST